MGKPMRSDDLAPTMAPRPAMPWATANGTWIAGRAVLDGVDALAAEMEAKWGAGRLRLLVSADLREKFDRQRYLLNQAIWHGDLESIRREGPRMATAWRALDRAATAAGAGRLDPMVWEIALDDGSVAAIVPETVHAARVAAEGRKVSVYTLDELARILSGFRDVAAVKATFPGAAVTAVRRTVPDPLDAIHDTALPLDDGEVHDDEIPF